MVDHEQCGRCGRKLKSLKSREDGYGPVCKRKVEKERELGQAAIDAGKEQQADAKK